jgi:hypothetical protein
MMDDPKRNWLYVQDWVVLLCITLKLAIELEFVLARGGEPRVGSSGCHLTSI